MYRLALNFHWLLLNPRFTMVSWAHAETIFVRSMKTWKCLRKKTNFKMSGKVKHLEKICE